MNLKKNIEKTLGKFNEGDPKMKKAAEISLATLTCKDMEGTQRKSPFLQICGRPQIKNESSNFNELVAEVAKDVETILRKDGYKVSFVSIAADTVSASSASLRNMIRSFLLGLSTYSVHTDTNHNTKNGRYQYVIGRNNVKTISTTLIDTGLLKKSYVSQDLWRVKDFASDLLVLILTSPQTVSFILSVECADCDGAFTLVSFLYFMRVHLFAVNSVSGITAKERVAMIWSSLIYMLHIDGTHHITKRNLILKCVSMCFVILQSDVIRPHRITSEPSKHSIALIWRVIWEGTVNDFISSISRLAQL